MDRTSPPPKTNITTLATALATAMLAIWMANFAAQPHSLYADSPHAPVVGRASVHADGHPARGPQTARARDTAAAG